MRRSMLSVVIAALAVLANPNAWAGGTKRVVIQFKSGSSQAARDKVLKGLKAKHWGTIESNDIRHEFVAVAAEVPEDAVVAAVPRTQAAGAGASGLRPSGGVSLSAEAAAIAGADVVDVEMDFRAKWIEEAAPISMAAAAFPAGATLGQLGLQKFAKASSKAAGASAAMEASGGRSEIPWGIQRVRAPSAWDYTEGAKVRVAIIDTGIDLSHPDLAGKVDGGYGAVTDSDKPEAYQDDNGHGTHVSGTIAAVRNGKGVVGVAPRARLYAVKVLDKDGSGTLFDVIKGIVWCADNGIQVANMSLGSSMPSPSMQRALKYAKARGVVVVAAAGNSGESVGYPAAYPETIAVSASDWNDQIAGFSSRGPEVKFIAPGVAVVSSYLGGDYANLSGTSMATPHVTGLAALAVSLGYRGLDGPDGVLAQLKKAAKPLDGLSETDQGFGMIDAGKLVRSSGAGDMVASLETGRRR